MIGVAMMAVVSVMRVAAPSVEPPGTAQQPFDFPQQAPAREALSQARRGAADARATKAHPSTAFARH